MASVESSASVQWAAETRLAIGRPRRGEETRTEQTALPDKEQLAMASRLTNLKEKIDQLALVAPPSAMGVVQTKYELLKRSLLGGNAATMETPLSQLESTVAQLLVQSKPKPVASGPQRAAPLPPTSIPPTPIAPTRHSACAAVIAAAIAAAAGRREPSWYWLADRAQRRPGARRTQDQCFDSRWRRRPMR